MAEPVAQHYATLMGIARGYQRSQAPADAAELGIADLVGGGSRSTADRRSTRPAHQLAQTRRWCTPR
jgi:hypothetical protein